MRLAAAVCGAFLLFPSMVNGADPFIHVKGDTVRAPIGWALFCQERPNECRMPLVQQVAQRTLAREELERVNTLVNEWVKPLTDREQYGTEEYWTYPSSGYGDCEDYVLLKRKLLIERGWPVNRLLITVVAEEKGTVHAVLIARTDEADYLLDNAYPNVERANYIFSTMRYTPTKMQSVSDPNIWIAIN